MIFNRKLRFVLMCVIVVAAAFGCAANTAAGKVYDIGDTGPAGGLIFYDQGATINGWRYLEVAPTDQSASTAWGAAVDTGATAQGIGAGKANTDLIVSAEPGGSAAEVCQSLTLNGYSDWFLPSMDELDAIFSNLSTAGHGNLAAFPAIYWTSTEVDTTTADSGHYTGGSSVVGGGQTKVTAHYVRAIRAFD